MSNAPPPEVAEVTALLAAWSDGDAAALAKLLPRVQNELHRLAHRYISHERKDHTLQTTALVNEAYLKLVQQRVSWCSRAHFFAISAQIMRRIPLAQLSSLDPRKGRVVELRYFGGLSVDEISEVLNISAETVTRDWRRAKAFLRREISRA